ncbi:MAG: hypothetical protein E7500_00385 [Ruminococcus sp.]|nr:hypothetical protein [Ruminococcus sp.]
MANSISKFKKYIDKLDEVYALSSLTAKLDSDSSLVKAGANANEIIIPKLSMDGLADYSRNSGYVKGDVTFTNETVAYNYDRGRKFDIDAMDNEETVGLAFGKLSSEFIRTRTIPEMDAFRFATYAAAKGISTVDGALLTTGEQVVAALSAAVAKMDEDEVPSEDRHLFITPVALRLVKDMDTTKSKEVLESFASITKVPQNRFYTAIKLNDGTTSGEEAGGYTKADGAADINFMIVHKTAVIQYPKHVVNKIIEPEANQESDGWLFFYRAYGLADVYENKTAGIYLHKKPV